MLDGIFGARGCRFGPYLMFPAQRILLHGEEVVDIRGIEMTLLAVLVDRAGKIVSKDELLEALWGSKVVEEDSLAKCLGRLRSKLEKGLIKTVHGVGCALDCEIEWAGSVDERFALYLAGLLDQAEEEWETTPDDDWKEKYAARIADVRHALDWALASPRRNHIGIALAGPAGRLFEKLSLGAEGRRYLDRFIDRLDNATPRRSEAKLLRYGALLCRSADRRRSVALSERAAKLYRDLEDNPNLGSVLGIMGGGQLYLGHYAEAKQTLAEAMELLSGTSRVLSLLNVMNAAGILAQNTGDPKDAVRHFSLAVVVARNLKDPERENLLVLNLAEAEFQMGALDRAIVHVGDAVRAFRAANAPQRGWAIYNLAGYLTVRGDLAQARPLADEALSLLVKEGERWLRSVLQLWALLGAIEGRHAEAARLGGFVNAAYKQSGEIREALESKLHDMLWKLLAENLHEHDIEAYAAEGAGWREETAVVRTIELRSPAPEQGT